MKPFILILIFLIWLGCIDSSTKSMDNQEHAKSSNSSPDTPSNKKEVHQPTTSCNPYLKPTTSTLQKYIVFQAIDFSPTEPDCWKALKNHGISFCKNKFPCRIIYIENDKLGPHKKDPFYPDFDALKKYGIAEFTKMQNGWQLSGADSNGWERNADGFDYFEDE